MAGLQPVWMKTCLVIKRWIGSLPSPIRVSVCLYVMTLATELERGLMSFELDPFKNIFHIFLLNS